ncbi:MAG: phosphatase PAP2 family protein [Jatrophihabitans sp.]
MTTLAGAGVILFVLGMGLGLALIGRHVGWVANRALAPLLAYVGGDGLVFLIRAVVHRDRPPTANSPAPGAVAGVHGTSYSFPSGHSVAVTAVFFALFGLLTLTSRSCWPWLLAFGLSASVADSRLLLGVHWFSYVGIGMAVGIY